MPNEDVTARLDKLERILGLQRMDTGAEGGGEGQLQNASGISDHCGNSGASNHCTGAVEQAV